MSLKFSEIQTSIKAQMDTLTGFKQSKFPVEFFNRTSKPVSHLGYSVSLGSSIGAGGRQRTTGAGVELNTVLNLVFAYRLRPTDIMTDYRAALDKEELVILKLLSSYSGIKPQFEIQFRQADRTFPESLEFSVHNLIFNVYHYIK